MAIARYFKLFGILWSLIWSQILQSVVVQARKLEKAVYVFSVDPIGDKVAHVNFVPATLKEKGADARVWATKVSEILGGKVCYFYILSKSWAKDPSSGWR
jgi:hypothetical protein